MTRKEKVDWLYRLRSEICVYIPRRWLIPIYSALDTAIDELERETVSKESYDREYFIRKELELKVAKLEEQLAKQKHDLDKTKAKLEQDSFKNELAQERYQDLIDYFGDEDLSKIIHENRKEFKKWLERIRWQRKRADECARELEKWERFKPNEFKWFQKYLILLNKVIQVRNGIENQVKFWSLPSKRTDESVLNIRKAKAQSYKYCLDDLDKLIEGEKK